MDKYQLRLLNRGNFSLVSAQGDGTAILNEQSLRIEQNENYAIVNYSLIIKNETVESVRIGSMTYPNQDGIVTVDVDFSAKKPSLTIAFKNDFADNCEIPLEYVDADKIAYDKKVAEQRKAEYLKNMNLCCRTGNDLINVHWRNASPDTALTTVCLYAVCNGIDMLIDQTKLKNDSFFKAYTGLAFGEYHISITQTDGREKILISQEASVAITNPFPTLESGIIENL